MKNRGRDSRNQRRNTNGGNGGDRRPPLDWQVVKVIDQGHVRGVITRALLDNGSSRYSFRIGKADRDDAERVRANVDSRDINDFDLVTEAVGNFLEGMGT